MAKEAKFVITLDAEGGNLNTVLAAFKKTFTTTISDLERATRDLKLFVTLEADLKRAAAQVDLTRASLLSLQRTVATLRAEGEPIGAELAKSLAQAQKAAANAERDFVKQSQAVDKLRTSLKAAGVDVNNLAAAEAKLAVETQKAAAAQLEQQQKQATGFKTLKDIKPEIDKIVSSYQALATSGKLSFGELSTLHASAQRQLNSLQSSVGGVGDAFREVRIGLIAFAAAFAGVVSGASQSAASFRAFAEQLAAIGTIADVSERRLAELGDEVRDLSRAMGIDAVTAAQALYNIIGSGIPTGNAVEVLALSAQAARAGLTDVHTAAQIGVAILNGYGLEVSELEHVFDVLFTTVQDGVVTFPELAKNLGNVIPIARQANVRLEELGAAFVVLTRAGIDAPEAATAIGRAIQELSAPAPEAAERMRELNIEFRGLLGTVEQIASKNLSLQQLQGIIPEVRAIRAVASLAQNFELFNKSVERAVKLAGTMKTAYNQMADTPQARMDRFNAAIADLNRSIGEFVTNQSARFVVALTDIANAFNNLGKGTQQATIGMVAMVGGLTAAFAVFRLLAAPINALIGSLAGIGSAATLAGAGFTVATAGATAFLAAIVGFAAFQFGTILRDYSTPLRILGDVLAGTARVFSQVEDVVHGFGLALIGNFTVLKDAVSTLFSANGALRDYWDGITGTTERLRAQEEAQRRVNAETQRAADTVSKTAETVGRSVTSLLSELDRASSATAQAITTSQTRLTNLVASFSQNISGLVSAAGQAMTTAADLASQKIVALQSVDVQRVKDVTAIHTALYAERLAILTKSSQDIIAALNIEQAARLAIAKKSAEALSVDEGKRVEIAKTAAIQIRKVEQELAVARQATLQDIVNKFRAHVGALLELQQGHNQNLRQLEEQRKDLARDTEDVIRALRRSTLKTGQQYADQLLEIDQNLAKARTALQAGNNKDAELFAQKAIESAKQLGQAVIEDGRTVVTQSSAVETAISKIKTGSDLLTQSIDKRKEAEKGAAQAAADGLKVARLELQDYELALAAVIAQVEKGRKLQVSLDIAAVEQELVALQKLLDEQNMLLQLGFELQPARDKLNLLREELKAGIPVNLNPVINMLTAAIKEIEAKRPELQVLTTKATAQVQQLETDFKALEKVQPKLTIAVDAAEPFEAIKELKKPTSSVHTVKIRTVKEGDTAPTAPESGNETGTTFARGGLVGRVVRGIAGLTRSKTDGTPPKSSPVSPREPGRVHLPGPGGTAPQDAQDVLHLASGGSLSPEEAIALSQSLQRAYADLTALAYAAQGVRRDDKGLNLYDWTTEVLSKFHHYGTGRQKDIRDYVAQNFDDWMSDIEEARRTRSPVLLSDSAKALAFADGGPVPYARGRAVFRPHSWLRVPGSGSGDTVPALLKAGSFVVKKSASNFYGGALMQRLAQGLGVRRFAAGGQVTKDDVVKWAKANGLFDLPLFDKTDPLGIGKAKQQDTQPGGGGGKKGSFQSDFTFPPFNLDARQIPDELIIAMHVLNYAREMLNAVGPNNPLLGSLLPQITQGIRKVEANPKDKAATISLLQAAETIGANPLIFSMWGKTHMTEAGGTNELSPIWYYDWLLDRGLLTPDGKVQSAGGVQLDLTEFAKKFFGSSVTADLVNRILGGTKGGGNKLVKHKEFARGGGLGDSVRAMLTPGEFVVRKSAVSKFGVGLLNAINNMRVPRGMLAGMLMAPPVARFAAGGPVSTDNSTSNATTFGASNITLNLNASAADILSERNIRNYIVPLLRTIQKQTGS